MLYLIGLAFLAYAPDKSHGIKRYNKLVRLFSHLPRISAIKPSGSSTSSHALPPASYIRSRVSSIEPVFDGSKSVTQICFTRQALRNQVTIPHTKTFS